LSSEDILSVGVGEPDEPGNPLAFVVHVAGVNPDSLPPNVFWRVLWTGPGGQRYVDLTNCATGGPAAHYGHFTTTGSVLDGAADGYSIKDNRITIRIDKSKVDNPGVGATLVAINADCRTVAGNCGSSPAAFAPNDVTNSGQY